MTARTFLFVGVGGQGALSAAGFLGEAVFRKGLPVTVSQLHGMSQRGGSVQAAVTVGTDRVLSPASQPIDVLIGLELIEAARVSPRMAMESVALCNLQVVPPPQLALNDEAPPAMSALLDEVKRHAAGVWTVDALALATRTGNPATLNTVLLGALSALPLCPVSEQELLTALLEKGSPRARELNRRAFALGRDAYLASTSTPRELSP
jgi:indolepyruvate ferredoxin oxidoreductase beta subunit